MQRRFHRPILLLLAVVFIGLAGWLQKDLNRQRTELG
jgi:hypothetical protein